MKYSTENLSWAGIMQMETNQNTKISTIKRKSWHESNRRAGYFLFCRESEYSCRLQHKRRSNSRSKLPRDHQSAGSVHNLALEEVFMSLWKRSIFQVYTDSGYSTKSGKFSFKRRIWNTTKCGWTIATIRSGITGDETPPHWKPIWQRIQYGDSVEHGTNLHKQYGLWTPYWCSI